MPSLKNIFILDGYNNGRLLLSDGGYTRAKRTNEIQWHVRNNNNVCSIMKISKKGGVDIFEREPEQQGNHWKAVIKGSANDYDEIEYYIKWRHKDGRILDSDPKIAVWPDKFHDQIIEYAVKIAVAALLAFLGYKLLRNKKQSHVNRHDL